jgi:hypothetical protein
MATLLLTAAGSAIAGAALPAGISVLGTTITGAAIGSAVGGALGQALDQRLFGPGAQVREGPRLKTLDLQSSTEGAPIPRVFGRMRLAGQIIWATRFKETASTERQGGGKGLGGGASVETTSYRYSVSFAVALCEGPIAGVGRIWADGKPMPLEDVTWRLHKGSEAQPRDPLIAALTPNTPAFRGTAYLVFEDLPLERYGNRLPQIAVEVRRPANTLPEHKDGPALSDLITGVALSPGSGEFALATQPVRRKLGEGISASENLNNTRGVPDFTAAMDQLEDSAPNVDSALLVVSWFGTDLRAGQCEIRPGVERRDKETEPLTWRVAGEDRSNAALISTTEGNPTYGGTPSDISVFQAIKGLRARGKKSVFYPFILMDIPPNNPQGQPVHPWRGRIAATSSAEVAAIFGTAQPSDFGPWDGETLSGPSERTLRRMVLHYAHLCAAAGGVDAFVIGSELRDLTQSVSPSYPAVAALKQLAADVRTILPHAKITYAADWSEYSGHRPNGEVYFHLDPLWADPNIDMIAIDNYLPLSDWRAGHNHADAQAYNAVYDLEYLSANIENGEHADWFYADEAARLAQDRTPLTDTAHGEDWVFGVKCLRAWWSNPHHDRPNGVRSPEPTAWQPQSKPIWFTETGCPAVDHGSNQPNVFVDPKSSESALPYFSRGVRDDAIQRRYLQAMLSYWQADPMVQSIHVWTWDTRPYPDFPLRKSVWSDGDNYRLGHWITGRLDAVPLAELVAELCVTAGESRIDVSRLTQLVDGYTIDRPMSARDALAPLMLTFGFDAVESGGVVHFIPRGDSPVITLTEADLVETEEGADPYHLTRAQDSDLPRAVRLGYIRSDAEFRRGAAEATLEATRSRRVEASDQAIALTSGKANAAAQRWLAESHVAQGSAAFALPPSRLALDATDVVALHVDGRALPLRLDRIADGDFREIEATRVAPDLYLATEGPDTAPEPPRLSQPAPIEPIFLDLPLLRGDEIAHAPYVAAFASPWPGAAVFTSVGGDDYRRALTLDAPATIGRTLTPMISTAPWRWSQASVDVVLSGGALLSRNHLTTLAGANVAAIETAQGWEVFQFSDAVLIAQQTYRLSGLLRGQAGTEPFIATHPPGARFVLIDEALQQLPITDAERGQPRHIRIGPATQSHDSDTYQTIERSFEGIGLRPYAPAHLRAVRQGDSIALSWVRRTRIGGDRWETEAPISEESERYRITIEQGGTADSVEVSSPAATVSAAYPATISVAQLSAAFGPGLAARIEI